MIKDQGMEKPIVLGHSMGGKWAMCFASAYPDMVSKLILVDIAPVRYGHYESHKGFIRDMLDVPLVGMTNRNDADAILKPKIPETLVRSFLLQNLVWDPDTSSYKWRINLDVLNRTLDQWIDPVIGGWGGPALFIGGTSSKYIKPEYHEIIYKLFPNANIEMIQDATHYLHYEKPKEFISLALPFIQGK